MRFAKLFLFLILMVLSSAFSYGYSTDADDNYLLQRGDEIKGSFAIIDYPKDSTDLDLVLSTSSDWIEFPTKNFFIEQNYVQEVVFVDYEIIVPEDAPIGVHRAVIKINLGGEIKYVNVKMSVQNGFFYIVFSTFNFLKKYAIIVIPLVVIIMIVLLFYFFKTVGD